MKKYIITLFLIVLFGLSNNSIFCQLTPNPSNHKLGLLLAGSMDINAKKFGFSPSLMYEFQFLGADPKMGIGLIGSYDLYSNPNMGGNLAFYYHPSKNLRAYFAPGVKVTNYKSPYVNERVFFTDTLNGNKLYPTLRLGLNYDFYWKKFTLSPSLNMEMYNKKSLISFGAIISYNF